MGTERGLSAHSGPETDQFVRFGTEGKTPHRKNIEQIWSNRIHWADSAAKEGNTDEAHRLYRCAMELTDPKNRPGNTIRTLTGLARTGQSTRQSMKNLEDALELIELHPTASTIPRYKVLTDLAELYLHSAKGGNNIKRLIDASEILHSAREDYLEIHQDNPQAGIPVHWEEINHLQGFVYKFLGCPDDGIAALEEAVEMQRKLPKTDLGRRDVTHRLLANLYLEKQLDVGEETPEYREKAKYHVERALFLADRIAECGPAFHSRAALTYHDMSQVLQQLGDPDTASNLEEHAYELRHSQ